MPINFYHKVKKISGEKFNIVFLFLLAFLTRALVIFYTKSYLKPELFEFEMIANNLLAGKGYVGHYLNTTYYYLEEPLYTFFMTAVFFFTNHSYLVMLLVQSLIPAVLAVLIYKIGQDIFDSRIGFWSAVLVALHPAMVYYSAFKLEYTIISSMFTALCILATCMFFNRQNFKRAIFLGTVFGLGILTRGTIVIFAGCASFWLLIKKKLNRKFTLVVLISFLVVIAPWIIRNYVVYGRFKLLRNNAINLWYGNNPNATGAGHGLDGRAMHEKFSEGIKQELSLNDEIGQNRVFFKYGISFILNNPAKSAELFFKKIYYFWWFSPLTGMYYSKFYLILYKLYYSLILFLGIIGLYKCFFSGNQIRKAKCLLIVSYFIFITLAHALYYVEGRHRWTVEPLLILFSTFGYYSLKGGNNEK